MSFPETFNLWSFISMFLLPLSLLGLGSLIITKKEAFITSLIIGSSITVILLSVWALFVPFGFKEISWLIFLIGIYGFFANFSLFKKNILKLIKSLSIKTSRDSWIVTVSKGLVIAFIIKLALFIFLRPTIDPDVVQYYLPFARSLIKYGHVPSFDFYTGLPLNNVSIGSLVLYGYSLAIGTIKNITPFKLIPFTVIIGIGAYWFNFIKDLTRSEKLAWLTLASLVSLPFADSALFETLFYPDYLFVLLFLFFINFILKLNKDHPRSPRFFITASIVISSMLLVKLQAILVILLLAGLLVSTFLAGNARKILIVLFAFSVVGFRLFNYHFFTIPNFLDFIVSPVIIIYLLLKVPQLSVKPIKTPQLSVELGKKHLVRASVWIFTIFFIGGVWWWRNLILSNNFFGDIGEGNYWASSVVSKVTSEVPYYQADSFFQKMMHKLNFSKVPHYTQPKFTSLAVLFWSVMGSFWIIPKITALFTKKNSSDFSLAYWFVGWYLIWIFYLGGVSDRHLLHVFPLFAYFISKGLIWLSDKLFKTSITRDKFIVVYLLLLSFVSLAQSRFLSWNLGTIFYGQETLHQVARETIGSDSLNQVKNLTTTPLGLSHKFRELITAINLSGYPTSQYFMLIIGVSVVVSSLLLIISYLIIKKKKLDFTKKNKVKMGTMIALVFSLPYLIVMLVLTKGKLFNFAQVETQKVYTYGGQFNELIPYLKEHLKSSDKIILLAPSTGLPYYLNHPVVDILNTYEIKQLRPILESNDLDEIESFVKDNNFKYLVIREDKGILSEVEALQERFIFFEKVTQLDTAEKIIKPNLVSTWSLYRLY